MNIRISDEVLGPGAPDLLAQIHERQVDALIKHERAVLAAICGDEVAWMAFPPTKSDDPADYAPYWQRLTDAVKDEDEREAIVAAWFNSNRT